jgi:hypothetical protein
MTFILKSATPDVIKASQLQLQEFSATVRE